MYLINHPAYIKYMLPDKPRNYHKSTRIRRVKPRFGDAPTRSEGELWRRQRRLMQPVLHHQQIAAWATVMIETTTATLERW